MYKPGLTKLIFKVFTFLSAVLTIPLAAQKSADGWIFKHEKDAVKVYYRKTSGVHELKLATSLKVSLSGAAKLFDDVDQYTTWGYRITEARLLKRVSPTEIYYYARVDFPWPMADRDLILHTVLTQDPNTQVVYSTSTPEPDYLPEVKDVIRMRDVKTRWTVIPGSGGWASVEYYLHSDPGGSLPDWAVNMALDMGPRETIKRMRKVLADPIYQNTKLAHIKE